MSRIKHYLGDLRLSACYSASTSRACSTFLCAAFEDNDHRDFILRVSSEQVTAHRLVLSSTSPVFEAMFRHSFIENLNGHVDLTKSFNSMKLLRQFLSFLYEKPLELDSLNVTELLDASNRYLIGKLTEICSQYLFNQLSPSNCLKTWVTASFYWLRDLEFVCRHLFSEILPLVKIQNSIVISLPKWFITDVLMKSNLSDTFPILFPTLIIIWLLGNVKQRETLVTELFVSLNISEQMILTVFNKLDLNQTEQAVVKSVFARAFVFTAGNKNKSAKLSSYLLSSDTNRQKNVSSRNLRQHYTNLQHLCVMLLNETNNTAVFYCIERKKWRTLHLPAYDGTTLGIVAGNFLVRVTAKGSSANMFNLLTNKSFHTACVLSTLTECKMEIAFLPVESNFFLSDGQLHVALVVRRFRSFQLVVFRYDHVLNRWCFLLGFPLLRNLNHAVLRVYSTCHRLVYLIVTVQPFTSAIHILNTQSEFSHVFVVDLFHLDVIGSSCGYFGNSILNNDCFILMNKLHFVTNRPTLLNHNEKSQTTAKVLVINPYNQKYMHVLYPVRIPKLERLPIIAPGRKNLIRSELLSTVKESILCLLNHMGPYISNMFIFDIERRQWFQTPSPPPIFKSKSSKPLLIYTYAPISTLLLEKDPKVISRHENFFKEWQLGKIN